MSSKIRDQRVQCTVPGCSRVLSGYTGLRAHLLAHEKKKKPYVIREIKPKKDTIYRCSQCQRPFREKQHLIRHLSRLHDVHQQQVVVEILV